MKSLKACAFIIAALLVPAWFTPAIAGTPLVNFDSANNLLVVTLKDGDSLFPKLVEVVNTHGIKSGLILADIGRLRNFTLNFFDITIRETVSKYYPGPYNLAVTQGIIAHASDGTLNMDIVALCDSVITDLHASTVTSRNIGGHLSGGIVKDQNVILIKRLDTVKLIRDYHPENGNWDLDIKLASVLEKETTGARVPWRQEYSTAALGRMALFGSKSTAPVFDVAGRRINRLKNGSLEKMAPGMYVAPQQTGKTGTLIKK